MFHAKIDETIAVLIEDCDCLHEAWTLIKAQFHDTGFTAKYYAARKLVTTSDKPNMGHLCINGCDAWHHVPKQTPGFK
jgi:hypothetical protein